MKKWLLWMVTAMMLLTCFSGALAEDVEPYELGEGETGIIVYVVADPQKDEIVPFIVWTQEEYLMDALVEVGLIKVSETSWGYMVDGVMKVESNNGLYWNMYKFDMQNDEFVRLETPIQYTPVVDGDGYLFILQ